MNAKEHERAKALETLRANIKPGDTLYTVLRHVSRSGMSRDISVMTVGKERANQWDHFVAKALGYPLSKREGVRVSGCGMDMGFHLVYSLSHALFPAGFGCIGEGCPSNDHSNGDHDYTPHYDGTPRNSDEVGKDLKPYRHYHNNGGYALRHKWL